VGILLGAAASLGVSRLIASLLFDTSPFDPVTYAGISFGLLAVAVTAGYLPARRASRISPMVALRAE
jgi:ABC-type antimicrobial peptide transport system permease subunit